MSRQFDFEKEMKNAPVSIKSGEDAIIALNGGGNGTSIGSRDRQFQITNRGNRYEVTAPSSKKDGGTYYLDAGITNIIGDFYKRGSMMSATVYEQARIKELETEEDKVQGLIQTYMQTASDLMSPDGKILATWKNSKPSMRFNATLFQQAMPDVYQSFVVESPGARRFLVK